jgi:hypothetical protein
MLLFPEGLRLLFAPAAALLPRLFVGLPVGGRFELPTLAALAELARVGMMRAINRHHAREFTRNYSNKGANTVGAVNRRKFLTDILPGSIVVVAGFTTIGWSIAPGAAEAAETAQAVTVRPHRHMRSRHRRWGCWWQRGSRWWHWGHRVCGWR